VFPVRHGRLADLLGYDRRDVAVLAVDAALAVELRAGRLLDILMDGLRAGAATARPPGQ